MNFNKIAFTMLASFYGVMWAGGIGHYVLLGRPPLDAPWAASAFLLLAGLLVILKTAPGDALSLLAAASIGFAAEILGVRYGFIFSPYSYTGVLQPQVLAVPVVMLSAWMVLLAYVRQMLASLDLPLAAEAVLAAAWMTAIDLVIDPLAANQLGYWRWVNAGAYHGIPLHNFIGWFAVSLAVFLAVRRRWAPSPAARNVGLSIVLFFTAIAASYGLIVPAGVGLALCAAHFLLARAGQAVRPVPEFH